MILYGILVAGGVLIVAFLFWFLESGTAPVDPETSSTNRPWTNLESGGSVDPAELVKVTRSADPNGTGIFRGSYWTVISEGEPIEAGEMARVSRIEGNRLFIIKPE